MAKRSGSVLPGVGSISGSLSLKKRLHATAATGHKIRITRGYVLELEDQQRLADLGQLRDRAVQTEGPREDDLEELEHERDLRRHQVHHLMNQIPHLDLRSFRHEYVAETDLR